MEWIALLILMAAAFGVFYLIDKGFSRLFRGKRQHASGLALRLNKRYCSFGLILSVLGVACMFAYDAQGTIMLVAGGVILAVAAGMIIYYMTFGVFYDEEGFVLSTFGRKSRSYRYDQISGQRLYTSAGGLIVELHMTDGHTFHLQQSLQGRDAFLEMAFAGWCKQTGNRKENCEFYDPDNSCWFRAVEE